MEMIIVQHKYSPLIFLTKHKSALKQSSLDLIIKHIHTVVSITTATKFRMRKKAIMQPNLGPRTNSFSAADAGDLQNVGQQSRKIGSFKEKFSQQGAKRRISFEVYGKYIYYFLFLKSESNCMGQIIKFFQINLHVHHKSSKSNKNVNKHKSELFMEFFFTKRKHIQYRIGPYLETNRRSDT